jgi:hypothetical protein
MEDISLRAEARMVARDQYGIIDSLGEAISTGLPWFAGFYLGLIERQFALAEAGNGLAVRIDGVG